MADTITTLKEEIVRERKRLDELEKRLYALDEVVKGDKVYSRRGLIDDVGEFRAFMTEIKDFKARAVGISLAITAVLIPVGLWAMKNLEFVQALFGKK